MVRRDGSYSVDNFENSLIDYGNLFNDDISKLKAKILIYYYYIETRYFEVFSRSYWNEAINNTRYIKNDVMDFLTLVSEKIEDAIVANDYDVLVELSDSIDKYEVSEVLETHILRDMNISKVVDEVRDFKRKEMVVGKNVYKDGGREKEASFHKHLFTFLAKGKSNDEIIMSEIPLERNRFDIFWNNIRTKLSAIIELKVNDMSSLISDIQQLERYLDSDGDVIFYKQPNFGVLFVYRIGEKSLEDVLEILNESDYEFEMMNDSIVLQRDGKPIVIEVIFGAFE